MNQHLQNILKFIEQDNNLPVDEKNNLLKSIKEAEKEFEIISFKLDRTEKVKRTTGILLEETIEELEQKRKAVEKQNRELEIESSLERVRTVALSMNKPDDMLEVCKTISLQLQSLGIKEIRNVQTAIFYEERGTYMNYEYYTKHDKSFITETCYTNHEIAKAFAEKMLKGKGEVSITMIKGEEKVKDWLTYQKTTNVFIDTFLETSSSLNYYWFSLGPVALGISSYVHLNDDELSLFKRFLNVFELAYRRYLDIEKAIVQAKEAQLETSLERVRAQAMAMRTPEDLTGICEVLYSELCSLGFTEIRNAMINIHDDEKEAFVNFDYSDEIGKSINHLVYNIHPVIEKQIKQIRTAGDAFSETHFKGKDLEDWKAFRKEIGEKDDPRIDQATALYYYFYSIGTGSIGISTFSEIAEEKLNVLKRFRNVFNLSYQRYIDIAQAEAQAREAQIETALEKVRSRTMAMQSSNELQETAAVLFQEFKKLGADDMQQFTIGIYNEEERVIDYRVTSWAGGGEQENRSFQLDMEEPTLVKPTVAAWKAGKKSAVFDLTGDALQGWLNYRNKISGITINTQDTGGRRVITAAYFSKGHLTISTLLPLHQETIKTLERFANVFDGTYTRFLDLEKAEAQAMQAERDLIAIKEAKQKAEDALTELQVTQKQLIQSEKMASLGELTAGIAHEIQNPLNFVNNFSEVNKELLAEMNEEISKGNYDEVKAIAKDLTDNEEKINHHGKRADAIVKGMLQHSRTSTSTKEPSDINKLADEYLRLAYHGLRAKDKSFNATLKTDYDVTIGNINIIPQDIGRVILNLITNAFYVVDEKKKQLAQDLSGFKNLGGLQPYEPTVSVSTKKTGDKVLISVKDNGNGIPLKILDKIFQPFFTTKPTGQGTGLGLSLSYDIVMAHGGELKVETKEGEGTIFIIQIPVV